MEVDLSRPGEDVARKHVASIRQLYGIWAPEMWESFTEQQQWAVNEATRALKQKLAQTTTMLTEDIYGTKTHFIYELLQNADDNEYRKARSRSEPPCISFKLFKDRIVVDCNEDGFNYDHLTAICEIGRSSKKGEAQTKIGEKGIGFKSVFMVAWKVAIQSGDYSFVFEHRRTDKGLGRTVPQWFETDSSPPRDTTRMTLFLHEDGSPDELKATQVKIREELLHLKEGFLLFLQNLQKVDIESYDDGDQLEEQLSYSKPHRPGPATSTGSSRCALTKRVWTPGLEVNTSSEYYLFTQEVHDLAKKDNGKYSEEEMRTKSYATSSVVLGFHLLDDQRPDEGPQGVYAFLPINEVGFKVLSFWLLVTLGLIVANSLLRQFLIHGDFEMPVSRGEIVVTSARNVGLRSAIASTFVKAVEAFLNDRNLRYTWMRFLPDMRNARFDPFWSVLCREILSRLSCTSVLLAHGDSQLYRINQMRRYSDIYLDADENPLLPDADSMRFVSRAYKRPDLNILEGYGLHNISQSETLDLVQKDLALARESRIMSKDTPADWHERLAELLLKITYGDSQQSIRRRLRSFAILPLRENQWEAPDRATVYFGTCSVSFQRIPDEVGLKLIADLDQAIMNQRDQLFIRLGVTYARVETIREAIFNQHQQETIRLPSSWVNQLRYLYYTHHTTRKPQQDERLRVLRSSRRVGSPYKMEIYFSGDDKYGAGKLLRGDHARSEGINLHFLNDLYSKYPTPKPAGATETWNEWLWNHVGLRRYARLTGTPNEPWEDLSPELKFIERKMPESVVGFLRYNWRNRGLLIQIAPDLQRKAQKLQVMCEGGFTRQLSDTYLPFPELQRKASRLLMEDEQFPFLKLDEEIREGSYMDDWGFLVQYLGVGAKANLGFYSSILDFLHTPEAYLPIEKEERVMKLYGIMYGLYLQSHDQKACQDELRAMFVKHKYCYSPLGHDFGRDEGICYWHSVSDCIWDAPDSFLTKVPLRWQFAQLLETDERQVDDNGPESLFRMVLKVPLLTCTDIMTELEYLSECLKDGDKAVITVEAAHKLYSRLWQEIESLEEEAKDEIRSKFATKPLIFTENEMGGWFKVSQCLWSSHTEFRGKAILSEAYHTLESFFVGFLRVERLNARVVYRELLGQNFSTSPEGLNHLKTQLRLLASFVPQIHADPKITRHQLITNEVKIFPVRVPGRSDIELVAYATEFVIPDRLRLEKLFAKDVRMLNFDLEEVRDLSPLFSWLKMESRYLSCSVEEITSLDGTDAQLVSDKECRIGRKAKGLCRIAYHFGSPRLNRGSVMDLVKVIQSIQVHETDDIMLKLRLKKNGKEYEIGRSDFHMKDDGPDSGLKIWVPRNRQRKALCYASKLPSELFDWMMRNPSTNITHTPADRERGRRLVGIILSSHSSLIPEILEKEGIVSAGLEMDIDEDEVDDDSNAFDTPSSGAEESTSFNRSSILAPFSSFNNQVVAVRSSFATRSSAPPPVTNPLFAPPENQRNLSPRSPFMFGGQTSVASRSQGASRFGSETRSQFGGQSSGASGSQGATEFGGQSSTLSGGQTPASVGSPAPSGLGNQTTFLFGQPSASLANQAPLGVTSNYAFDFNSPNAFPSFPPDADIESDDSLYLRLLEKVVLAAQDANLPASPDDQIASLGDAIASISLSPSNSDELTLQFPTKERIDRNILVGAAGELYMFELLKKILPSFDYDNWQSKIRYRVKSHPNHSDITPWDEAHETADIVYQDEMGRLTAMLIERGYLDRSWTNCHPQYYLEVKSTPGACSTALHTDNTQYQLMQRCHRSREEIYIICRVYGMSTHPIGLRLYVDPAEMMARGELKFAHQGWKVAPRGSRNSNVRA